MPREDRARGVKWFIECYDRDKLIKFLSDNEREIKRFAYIEHNKDQNLETGEIKKTHFHLLVELQGRRDNTFFAMPLGMTPQQITKREVCTNWANAEAYMLHRTPASKYKYQYDFSEIVANYEMKEPVLKEAKDTNDILQELLTMARESESMSQFLEDVSTLGVEYIEVYEKYRIIKDTAYYSTKRRPPQTVKDFVKEMTNAELIEAYEVREYQKMKNEMRGLMYDTALLDRIIKEAVSRGLLLAEGFRYAEDYEEEKEED